MRNSCSLCIQLWKCLLKSNFLNYFIYIQIINNNRSIHTCNTMNIENI